MSLPNLKIAEREFGSRLFLGTGKFSSQEVMKEALIASGSELVTAAMKRIDLQDGFEDNFIKSIHLPNVNLLPNTSGVRTAKEAVFAAQLSREAFGTNWIKLEIHPDPRYLLPDPIETLEAARQLVAAGFVVLPYINADPVLCKRLEDVGVQAVMPLGSPIGSNQGLKTRSMLEIIIAESQVPVIVDAGIGLPSHACDAMEMGADAVLVNTAIAISNDPIQCARAFKLAVEAGRTSFVCGHSFQTKTAQSSSPLTTFLNEVS